MTFDFSAIKVGDTVGVNRNQFPQPGDRSHQIYGQIVNIIIKVSLVIYEIKVKTWREHQDRVGTIIRSTHLSVEKIDHDPSMLMKQIL